MAEKHLDKNGKNIRIGDIVIIHSVGKLFEDILFDNPLFSEQLEICKHSIGFEGIVTGFGCVEVNCYNPYVKSELITVSLADNEVEVIGNIRNTKKVSKL